MTYIPRGLDPYALPLAVRARERDRFAMASKYAYVVGDVLRRTSSRYRTEDTGEGWAPIDFRILEHYVGSKYAGMTLEHLIGAGVLERKWIQSKRGSVYRYKDGHATQYRLTSHWRQTDLKRFELHPSYLDKIERHAEAMRLATFEAYPHLENTHFLLEGVGLADGWQEVVPGVDEMHRRASYLFSASELEAMDSAGFIFKLGPKGGRLFHPVTWTPKALREFVKVDTWEGQSLTLVDISNSQPLMHGACVLASMDETHPLRTFEPFASLCVPDPGTLRLATLENKPDPWRDLAQAFAQAGTQVLENQQISLEFDPQTQGEREEGEERKGEGRGRDPKCTEPASPENTGIFTDRGRLDSLILDASTYLMSATLPESLERVFTSDGIRWYATSGQVFTGDRYQRKTPAGWVEPWDVLKAFVPLEALGDLMEEAGCELTPTESWAFASNAQRGDVYETLQKAYSKRMGREVSRDETKLAFMDSMAFHDTKKAVPGLSLKFDGILYRGMWERVYHETYPEAFALGRWIRSKVGNKGQIRLLQRIESELVLGRVLRRLDGWAIPIHDALLVPSCHAQEVVQIFKEEAREFLRMDIPLNVSELGNLWTQED